MFDIENRRYTGSKKKLQNWIEQIIDDNCNGESFADIFAGTGIIAHTMSKKYNKIIVNDILFSNYCIYKAFFEDIGWDKNLINELVIKWNAKDIDSIEDNYISTNFGGKYFSYNGAKRIGYIRDQIENLKNKINEKEYNILLASLIYSADKSANTVGHYEAYLKNKNEKEFKYNLINTSEIKNIDIHRKDSNYLVKEIRADIVYIDPPYNSRQYSRFYHVLETLVKWDKPKLEGVAKKPPVENMSEYCSVRAKDAFRDLVNNIKAKYIIVSYNNTYNSKSNSSKNKISMEDIIDILSTRGNVKIFEKSHKCFNSGKTDFKDHKEYIYLIEVK